MFVVIPTVGHNQLLLIDKPVRIATIQVVKSITDNQLKELNSAVIKRLYTSI